MGWNLVPSGFENLFADTSVVLSGKFCSGDLLMPDLDPWVVLPKNPNFGSLFRGISLGLFSPGTPNLLLHKSRVKGVVGGIAGNAQNWDFDRIHREHQGSALSTEELQVVDGKWEFLFMFIWAV